MSATNPTKSQAFLNAILPWKHSSAPGTKKIPGVFGLVTVESHRNKKGTWMNSHRMNLRLGKGSISERLPRILERYKDQDIYFETGLKNPKLIKERTKTENIRGKRGNADEVSAVLFMSLDIDCAKGAHASGNLPPRHDALNFLRHDCPMQPSMVVDSGGGYHAYWLLESPYIIESKDEQREVEAYKKGFQIFMAQEFEKRGWHLDNVSDLSRVLRLPGTANTKYPGHVVDFEFFDDEPWNFPDVRFSLADFERFKAEVENPYLDSYAGDKYNPAISIKGSETGKAAIIDAVRQVCAEAGTIHLNKRLPLTGWLLRSGVSPADVFDIILNGTCHHRARIDGDENARDVARSCVDSTIENLKNGKKVTGFPKLAESIGEDNAAKIGALVFKEYQDQENHQELAEFFENLKTRNFDNSSHEQAQKQAEAKLKERIKSFTQAPSQTQSLFRKFAENNESLCWDLIRVLEIPEVSKLSPEHFAEAFSGMGLDSHWLEDARAKPLELEDAKTIRKTMRECYKVLGCGFWEIMFAFSDCIAQDLLETIAHLELYQSVHYSDEAFVESMKHESANYAHKLTALNDCGKYDCKTYVNDITKEDHGTLMRGFRSTCKASNCPRCQGFYIKEQHEHHAKSEDAWTREMLTVEIRAEDDTPGGVAKVWNRGFTRLRNFGIRGALHPTFSPLKIEAGVFFIAENTEQARNAFSNAFPDAELVTMTGKKALHHFSLLINLNAIRTREMIITKDAILSKNPWLGTVKLARKRGNCQSFPWLSFRAWKDFKRLTADEPADNRPGIQKYTHVKTGILLHEQTTEFPPLQNHEIIKIASQNEQLQLTIDNNLRRYLGPTLGGLIACKRRATREYKARIASGAKVLDALLL